MIRKNINYPFYDGSKRKIRVLLPDGANKSATYPALYLFDGQNVFDPEDSYVGVTWEVREAIELLTDQGKLAPMVIIAIDHAEERRLNEYGPFSMKYKRRKIKGEGIRFAQFLVEELIPYLEKKLPLIPKASSRYLAGSSMGGLMTAYTVLAYPDFFAKAGIFSLCSWISKDEFSSFMDQHQVDSDLDFYIQVGGREGLDISTGKEQKKTSRTYLQDTLDFTEKLKEIGTKEDQILLRIGSDDWHSESCWKNYMPEFLQWLQGTERK
ncbi:alpha/beta hydrolase-fold protein [Proteiniclasticum sp. QWL-01]|uniref:alpha/beta hydrolase n=1 Tax=Proteiniclasticum sp. QWL-01 TaxID=3036945 RepID=UPI002209C889|nr:alpha/beta hydrolase-fold protein [Proteiniclasticum sp. QWL-01]UUM13271.1 alpha/beta hydrolase-fold protein [Clostridiaceae bacterium HFYG-1003]WFF71696.1 alpha/beta hydrolase-fold protein [Proteiniclasticum sp. QWL-01]